MRVLTAAALALALTAPALAQNNGMPTQRQGLVLVESIATRGHECDLLQPWQAAALRTQTRRELAGYDAAAREEIAAEIADASAGMTCDDALLNGWIEGASPGFEREMLPFFLVGYTAFAEMEPQPALFTDVTGRADYGRPLSMISAEIERLQDAGVVPEGGAEWDAFEARIDAATADIAAALRGEEGGEFPPEEAAGHVTDIASVTELWLAGAMAETGHTDTETFGSEDED